MQNINDLVSTLDNQVLGVLGSFSFSSSPLAWGDELDQVFSDIYASMVRKTKEDIRVAARGFRGQGRTAHLVHHVKDFASWTSMIRLMLYVVNLLSQRRMGMADLTSMVRSIWTRYSCWRDELEDAVDIFSILEESERTLEDLLGSLSDTIPHEFIYQGRDLIDQMVRLWVERKAMTEHAASLAPDSQELQQLANRLNSQREGQETVIRAFGALIIQVMDVPPFHLMDWDFAPRQLIEANLLYGDMCVRCRNLNEEMMVLESMLTHLLESVEDDQE